MRRFSHLVIALAALVMFGAPAAHAASLSGTHAWSSAELTLRNGPGTNYKVTGQLAADLQIKVLRCEELWCLVDGNTGRGWTYKHSISFGVTSARWPRNVNPHYPSGGPGSVCFYQGTNFTGARLCLTSGRVLEDLLLIGLDNSFSSVRIEGDVSVAACRDRDFQSYCERIIASQPSLHPYLRRTLSSVRVY